MVEQWKARRCGGHCTHWLTISTKSRVRCRVVMSANRHASTQLGRPTFLRKNEELSDARCQAYGCVTASSSFKRQGDILPKRSRVAPAMSSAFDTPLSINARPVLAQIFLTTSAPFSRTIRPRCWTAAAVADLRIASGELREVNAQYCRATSPTRRVRNAFAAPLETHFTSRAEMPLKPGIPPLSAGTTETASGATISPRSSDSRPLATKAVPATFAYSRVNSRGEGRWT